MKPEITMQRLAETFKVLGDTTRTKIIFALSREELCVCDIANLFRDNKVCSLPSVEDTEKYEACKVQKKTESWPFTPLMMNISRTSLMRG